MYKEQAFSLTILDKNPICTSISTKLQIKILDKGQPPVTTPAAEKASVSSRRC